MMSPSLRINRASPRDAGPTRSLSPHAQYEPMCCDALDSINESAINVGQAAECQPPAAQRRPASPVCPLVVVSLPVPRTRPPRRVCRVDDDEVSEREHYSNESIILPELRVVRMAEACIRRVHICSSLNSIRIH